MGKRILIIDDDLQDQKLMKKLLEREGYTDVFFAETGEEGIASAQENLPDVVLVDTQLPGMDGFETCRKIKSNKKVHTKVIIVTGAVESIDAKNARESGSDAYCAKTRDCANLLDAVKKLI